MRQLVAAAALTMAWMAVGPVKPALGVPSIILGMVPLQPDTPGQVVEIRVTGGDPVQGLNLIVAVADGGPENPLGPGPRGPRITGVDILDGTIFANNNTGEGNPGSDLPQVVFRTTTVASEAVPAEGLLARVTLDTTGILEGTFKFSLGVSGSFTDLAGIEAELTDGLLVVGFNGTGGNLPPTADAGPDQQVQAGATVHLAGSGSDPESAALTYRWRQINGPGAVLSDWSNPAASFTAPDALINTDLVFELTVSDGVNTDSDTVTITVGPNESLFTVDAGADQTVAPGALVQLVGTIISDTRRSWSIEWLQVGGPTVALTGSTTVNPSFSAPLGVSNTQLTFEFRVFDGTYEAADTVTVTVDVNNTKPTAYAGEDQAVTAGVMVQLEGSATDPASLGLSYFWVQIDGPPVQLSSETVADPTFTAPSLPTASRLEFELRVSSGAILSIDTVLIHVTAASTPPNDQDPPDTQDPTQDDTDDEADYQVPTQTQQSVLPFADWPTSTAIAIGIGLLILALLLLWIFFL